MVSARKAIVSIVVLVLSVYFIAGVFGAIPYQYDYIKQNASLPHGAEQVEHSAYGNLTIYHSPVTQASINSPIKLSVRVVDPSGVSLVGYQYLYHYWVYELGSWHYSQTGGNGFMVLTSGNDKDGIYSYEIPAINGDVTNQTDLQYMIVARGVDTIALYMSPLYTIDVNQNVVADTIFGLDYRVFHAIGLGLTLIIGYVAYGSGEKVGKWKRK